MVFRLGAVLSKPRLTRMLPLSPVLQAEFRMCENSVGNARAAALSRVFVESTPWNPVPSTEKVVQRAANMLGKQMEPECPAVDSERLLRGFPAAKKKLYSEALSEPLVLPKHAKVSGFVKAEYVRVTPGKPFKPRAIQFRDPHFLAHMLPWMKPIEHAFYHGRYLFNSKQKYTCAKGMNSIERMDYLLSLVRELVEPVSVGLDGSAFDAHVSPGALKLEWKFYKIAMRAAGYSNATIAKAVAMGKCQLRNKVRFRCKDGVLRYTVDGNRMSGDLNTGLGNSVLQSVFIAAAMRELGIPEEHWRMLVDGDDAVLLVSGAYRDRLSRLSEIFERFSQELKVSDVTAVSEDSMETIEFCQMRPVRVQGVWRLVRSPDRVVALYTMSYRWFQDDTLTRRFFATVSEPELAYCQGLPMLQEFFSTLHTWGGSAKKLESVLNQYWLKNLGKCGLKCESFIDDDTRVSFEKAFGYTPLQQLAAEEDFRVAGKRSPPMHR